MRTTTGVSIVQPDPDLPEPLGRIVAEYRTEPATAIAYPVKAGQYIQVIDVAGSQRRVRVRQPQAWHLRA